MQGHLRLDQLFESRLVDFHAIGAGRKIRQVGIRRRRCSGLRNGGSCSALMAATFAPPIRAFEGSVMRPVREALVDSAEARQRSPGADCGEARSTMPNSGDGML